MATEEQHVDMEGNEEEDQANAGADDMLEGSDFDADDQDPKEAYVKKDLQPRPYVSEFEDSTEKEVQALIVKNARNLIRMRMTKPRREFGVETGSYMDKEVAESTIDLKVIQKGGQMNHFKARDVLDIGLQAGNQMKTLTTQTYFRRAVNASIQYDPNDFINEMKEKFSKAESNTNEKMDKFIDRVAYRVEEALQSNEIINVFQDDFEMLGDEEAATGSKISVVNSTPRSFVEKEYCENKSVSCIKFNPHKPFLVALSLIENLSFDDRCEIMGKSFDSHVLILNFSDIQIITLNYILQTPVEITCIEFHPENPHVIIGGAINGQLLCWDLKSLDHRITGGRKPDVAKMPDEEEDKTQQVAVKLKQLILSNIERSHRNFVSDIQFIPGSVKVDKKHPNEGKSYHFVSCSEDGIVNIWDTRTVDRVMHAQEHKGKPFPSTWIPFLTIQLFRQDGSGDQGLFRILFEKGQTLPQFYAASDEGDLLMIDWSIKPQGNQDGETKLAEYVRTTYETERSYRPVLALERSPFYDDLILTVHDFHFSIWKTSLPFEEQETPIYRSANTQGAHNTYGAFSPTRPGVIFISKTKGIDVWDFVDQSNLPSLTLNQITSNITFFKFQQFQNKNARLTQYLAYGDHSGILSLFEVPTNLRQPQENELETINKFWNKEIEKCNYVKDRRVTMQEEWLEQEKQKDIKKALEDAAAEQAEDAELERQTKEEEEYQELKLTMQAKLGIITDEELDVKLKEMKKKRQV